MSEIMYYSTNLTSEFNSFTNVPQKGLFSENKKWVKEKEISILNDKLSWTEKKLRCFKGHI